MVIHDSGPELVYHQVQASSARKPISPEALERFRRQDLRMVSLAFESMISVTPRRLNYSNEAYIRKWSRRCWGSAP